MLETILNQLSKPHYEQRDIYSLFVAKQVNESYFVLGYDGESEQAKFIDYRKCIKLKLFDYQNPTAVKKYLKQNGLNNGNLTIVRVMLNVGYNNTFLNS